MGLISGRMGCTAGIMLTVLVFLGGPVYSQSEEAQALNRRAIELHRAGKTAEAIPLAKQALELREKSLPEGHRDIATSLNNLAFLYETQGQRVEAEALYKRTLAAYEKTLPAGHPDIAAGLGNLAAFYKEGGRHAEAEVFSKRAQAIEDPEHRPRP